MKRRRRGVREEGQVGAARRGKGAEGDRWGSTRCDIYLSGRPLRHNLCTAAR